MVCRLTIDLVSPVPCSGVAPPLCPQDRAVVPYSANRREFRVAELELGLRLDYQDDVGISLPLSLPISLCTPYWLWSPVPSPNGVGS